MTINGGTKRPTQQTNNRAVQAGIATPVSPRLQERWTGQTSQLAGWVIISNKSVAADDNYYYYQK